MTTNIIRFCKKCQSDTERLVSSGRCKPCNQATGAAYGAANREKLKAYGAAWRKANPEKYKASIEASRAKNPEYKAKNRARVAAWTAANPDKAKASVKAAQIAKAAKFALYEAYYLANHG